MADDDEILTFSENQKDETKSEAQTTPAAKWERDSVKRSLDELFTLTLQYKTSRAYYDLLQFVARFRKYSPFNAMLVHVQKPGARYVAPPNRWLRDHGRRIRPGAHPLVILQPMGPVMFVFDVSDTESLENAPPFPTEIERPFDVRKGHIRGELDKLLENAKRDGLRVSYARDGSQSAGSIRTASPDLKRSQKFQAGFDRQRKPTFMEVPIRFDLVINDRLSREGKYATVVHELAHLYCGHLGTPDPKWWPDRQGLNRDVEEFEAESVAYLVCTRLGIDNPSERYLSGYVGKQDEVPNISLDCVLKVAGLIESMSRKRMKPRKPSRE